MSRIPAAEHYIGYVDDNETPEEIMKKFEQMQHVMEATGDKETYSREGEGSVPDAQG